MNRRFFNLRSERIRYGLTQEKMCELLGLSRSAYSMKENGLTGFTIDEVIKITKYLQCKDAKITMDYLFFRSEDTARV